MSDHSCVICLAELLALDNPLIAHTNACSHSFHLDCLRLWSQTSNSCPICRTHFTEISATETLGGPVIKRENVETRVQASSNTDFGFGDDDDTTCSVCGGSHDENVLLLCDMCDEAFHTYCVQLDSVPEGDWYCASCEDIRQSVPEINGRASTDASVTGRDRIAHRARRNTRISRAAGYQARTLLRQQRNSVLSRLRNEMRRERAEEAMNRVMAGISTQEAERGGTKRKVDEINDADVHDLRRNLLIDRRFDSSVTSRSSSMPRSGAESSSSAPAAVDDVDKAWLAFDRARRNAGKSSIDTAADRTNSTGQRPRFRPSSSSKHLNAGPSNLPKPSSSTLLPPPSIRTTADPIATRHKNSSSTLHTTHPFSSRTLRTSTATASLAQVTPPTPVPRTWSASSFASFSGTSGHHHSPNRINHDLASQGNDSTNRPVNNDSHHGKKRSGEETRSLTANTIIEGETDDIANAWKAFENAVRPSSRHVSRHGKRL